MKSHEAVLLFDEGPGIGLGHRRRAEALALELQGQGWSCRLVPLAGASRVSAPIVVVDSYIVRADEMEADAGLLVAIDDLGRDLDVDVLIDPSPGARARAHVRARLVLAGAPYALVGRAFPSVKVIPATAPVRRVLVTTGAADSEGIGARIAGAIHAARPDLEIRLVVGPWGDGNAPDGVFVVHAPPSLIDEMAAAPLVVSAGGVALLEACVLSRATIAIALSDNQRTAVDHLAALGAVISVPERAVAAAVALLAEDRARRAKLAAAAGRVLDGGGPARVAQQLIEHALVVGSAP